ncbi:MAG: hypothetical protein LC122_08745, partial [Chitinophagales bacterium]|nr:hypothetical protein [Chitinophagales bacterium]
MYGPYNLNNLNHNPLKHGDKIWYEGLADWLPVEEVDFVASFIQNNSINKKVKKSLFKRIFNL